MNLDDLSIYTQAMTLGEEVWKIVMRWDLFSKETVGIQLVKAADSIAANISEGYGRYHYKDAKNFNYYSRGSLYETKSWLAKAHYRGLVDSDHFKRLIGDIETLAKMFNSYIRSIGVNEPTESYGLPDDDKV